MEAVLQIDFQDRYFNPDTGRFLSEDPIGFDGGSSSFYRYVENNPINYIDPEGEFVNFFAGAITGGVVGALIGIALSECPISTGGFGKM